MDAEFPEIQKILSGARRKKPDIPPPLKQMDGGEKKKTGEESLVKQIIMVDILKKLAKQSKIVSMVLENIAKAVGLLIDLILLPFLPIIVNFIILLYKAVLGIANILNPNKGGGGEQDQGVINAKKITPDLFGIDIPNLVGILGGILAGIAIAAFMGLGGLEAAIVVILVAVIANALVEWGYKIGSWAGEFFYKLGKDVGAMIVAAGAAVGKWILDINVMIRGLIYEVVEGVKSVVGGVVKYVTDTIVDWSNSIKNAVVTLIPQITSAIQSFADNLWAPIQWLLDKIQPFLKLFGLGGGTTNTTNNVTLNGLGLDEAKNFILNLLKGDGARFMW